MNSDTVSGKILHPDIHWHQATPDGWHIVNYNEMQSGITQWKNILTEVAEFKPGHKFAIEAGIISYPYITGLFAGIELGGRFVVTGSLHPESKNAMAPTQVWMYNNADAKDKGKNIGAINSIPWDMFYTFESKHNTFEHLDQYQPSATDPIIFTATSGTTGPVKVIEYNHSLVSTVIARSKKIFNFVPEDRVLHLSYINHGPTAAVFFFPALSSAKYHYSLSSTFPYLIDDIVELVKKERITKAMFPNNFVLDQFLQKVGYVEHDLDIYINQANYKNWAHLAKKANIRSVNSLFGSTETMGPIFLNTITRDTNEETFNPLNYGPLLDDHFSVELSPANTVVTINGYYKTVLNDAFVLDEHGNHHYQSRTDLIRIHDVVIPMKFVEDINYDYAAKGICVFVPDIVFNKIYCMFDSSISKSDVQMHLEHLNEKLSTLSPLLKIDEYDSMPLEEYLSSIKLSLGNIRLFFRLKLNLL